MWDLWYGYRAVRVIALLLVCAVIALLVWLLLIGPSNGDNSSGTVQAGGGPVGASEQQLVTLSQELHQPVYWAGIMPGTQLELTETDNGYPYVRYLPQGTAIGDPSPDFLTVGTYPAINAFDDLRSYANSSRADLVKVPNGGVALKVPGSPTSVYFAYPHEDVQVEVYDPHPHRALDLVKTGEIRPVTTSNPTSSNSLVQP